MNKNKLEFPLRLDWSQYLQCDLDNIFNHIDTAIKRMKLEGLLTTSSVMDTGENPGEIALEHDLSLSQGGRLSIKKVTSPLHTLKTEGIHRIVVTFNPGKNVSINSTRASALVYGLLWRISKKMTKMKREESFILAQVV